MLNQTTTHASLIARLGDREDPSAWREFWERYGDLIRGFAKRRGVQGPDADDLVQDVMVALTKAMPGFTYDPTRGKFRSYLKTVVVHAISRRVCQNRPVAPLQGDESAAGLTPAADDGQEEAWELEWRQHHLRTGMRAVRAEFGEGDLAAFDLYVQQQRPAEETAKTLGISVDRVYQAKSRILRRLGEIIAQQVEEEG